MKLIDALLVAAAVILFLSFLDAVKADEIQLLTTSRHFNKDPNKWYNETNPGLLYAHNVTENFKAMGGAYRNTYKEITLTLGGEYQTDKWHGLSVGGQLGLGTGYKQLTGQDVSVVGSLFGQYNPTDNIGVRLSVIPHKEGAVGLSIVIGID